MKKYETRHIRPIQQMKHPMKTSESEGGGGDKNGKFSGAKTVQKSEGIRELSLNASKVFQSKGKFCPHGSSLGTGIIIEAQGSHHAPERVQSCCGTLAPP
jgi:hypothetical protein